MTSALDELYGLGFAHADLEDALYEAVTLDQVKAVAAKYLRKIRRSWRRSAGQVTLNHPRLAGASVLIL